jgi:PAS domain S-box-containing protein
MNQEADSLNVDINPRLHGGEVIPVGVMNLSDDGAAASEALVREVTLMAIAEINQSGGLLGRSIEPLVFDMAANDGNHALQARYLITELGIKYLFGGGTSASRKAMIPVLTKHQGQLWFPYAYEGLETSENVIYSGACPNQVVQPAVSWLLQNFTNRVYLIGSEGIYSRTVNKIIRAQINQQAGILLCEDCLPCNQDNYSETIAKIKHTSPHVVISTLVPSKAIAFLAQYAAAGISAQQIPVLSLRLSEVELQQFWQNPSPANSLGNLDTAFDPALIAGHFVSANYFQSLDNPQNQAFLQKAKIWLGQSDDDLAVNAAMQSAYTQVFLWKQAIESAQSLDFEPVKQAFSGQSYLAPVGKVVGDRNHHVHTACRIATINERGKLEVIYTIEPIKPKPWLGAEDLDPKTATILTEMLGTISQDIQQGWQLERDAQELESTIAQLLGRGHGKGRNQLAPEITRAAMSKMFKANQRLLKVQADLLNVESVLRETNELLEQRVEQRTQQLQKTIKRLQNEAADRQQAESLLRESQQRFSAIADNIPGVVYRAVLKADGEVAMPYISPRTHEIFGISVEEFYEHLEWVFDMAHPEDRAELNELVRQSAETLGFFEHEYRVSSLFEKVKWVRIISQPHLNEQGDTVWDGVIVDITHQKATEESLREAEEKYRSIFEHAIEGIFQAQPDGCFTNANPALAKIYGYEDSSALLTGIAGDSQRLFVEPERWQEFRQQIMTSGAVTGFEALAYKRDRSMIWLLINATANYDVHGNLISYEGLVQDITERKQSEQALKAEQEKSENLLLNILPQAIVHQLKSGSNAIASRSDNVTILFADIVDFTTLSTQVSPNQLVYMLNEIFSSFDMLADQLGLEKIKTIGDSYMVVGGLPTSRNDHAEAIAEMAISMQRAIARFMRNDQDAFRLRIGINTGSVVAGVIGIRKFIYDLWGDAVNVASRMESHGLAGGIQVTANTYELLKDKYDFWHRGKIFVKGRGEMDTYMLLDRKHITVPVVNPILELPSLARLK